MRYKYFYFLLFTVCLLLGGGMALAIPAIPRPVTTILPDGSRLSIRIIGDEWNHSVETADGFPLSWNETKGVYEYAITSDTGALIYSGVTAHDEISRTESEKTFLRSLDKNNLSSLFSREHEGRDQSVKRIKNLKINDFPSTGSPKALVILVEFSDLNFSGVDDPRSFYNDMFNKRGFTWSNGATGSVADYYADNSFDAFTPDFIVAGPVKLSKPAYYYGADSGVRKDAKVGEGLREACLLADEEVNFADFDTDGDGKVDNVYFCYAGYGQADSGISGTIWPHSYYLSKWGYGIELDGVGIDRYIASNELCYNEDESKAAPAGIGTFVHEFAHVLGLPDLYATDYSNSFHPGEWDLMAVGSYNNNSHTPPYMSAYERACLGWGKYTELAANTTDRVTLNPLSISGAAYSVSVRDKDGEFFVLENRIRRGWDQYLPGEGMLIWHLDEDEAVWDNN